MGQSIYGRRKPAVVHSWPKKLHVLPPARAGPHQRFSLWALQPTPGALTRLPHLAHNENCCSPSFPQTLLNPKPPNWFRRFPRSPTLHDARLPPGEAIGHASGRIDEPSSGKPVVAGLRAAHSFDSAGCRSSRLEHMTSPEASRRLGWGHMNLWILWREGSLAR